MCVCMFSIDSKTACPILIKFLDNLPISLVGDALKFGSYRINRLFFFLEIKRVFTY